MYAKAIVEERLSLAAQEFGFYPEYHTVGEVEQFEEHLRKSAMYVYGEGGLPVGTQNLDEFCSRWMLNEQMLVMCDASYFLTRYAFLKDERNIVRRFGFRVPQVLMFDIIASLESLYGAIELMVLKARQLGVSTLIALLIAHRVIFSHGSNAIEGSADRVKTGLMAKMLLMAYDMLPVWLKPAYSRRVESDQGMLEFAQNASGISFQHGAQTSGIARGTTATIYHLSECASFTNPVQQVEAALLRAVHASPNVFGCLESTGEGDIGWWPEKWKHAKANWHKGRARHCPVFLPWFTGTDIYPTPTWIRMRPVPENWRPNPRTREHVAQSELYVRTMPLLSRHLGADYRMPREQQWFWEVSYEEHKAQGMESVFLQEMAGSDEEALQRGTESVFGYETIEELVARRKPDYEVYGLAGQSIEEGHEPPTEDVDYSTPRLPLRFQSPRGESYRWELIPLRFAQALDESDPGDAVGKLFVFHHPKPGKLYSIGVDTSNGVGEDSTVASVWALGERGEPDVQVAEFASCYVSHVEAFAFVMAIACYYSKYMIEGELKWRQPYVSIEQVAAVGDTCQFQMKRMGYSNFHRMVRYDSAKTKKGKATKMGWFTHGWSRPILTGNFVHAVQNGWARVNSPWLIEEMKHFEAHVTATGKPRMEHEEGENDDRIFGAAMAVFCPHDMDVLAERSAKRISESVGLRRLDTSDYRPNVVSVREMEESVIPYRQGLT